jgi:hypothetical protein
MERATHAAGIRNRIIEGSDKQPLLSRPMRRDFTRLGACLLQADQNGDQTPACGKWPQRLSNHRPKGLEGIRCLHRVAGRIGGAEEVANFDRREVSVDFAEYPTNQGNRQPVGVYLLPAEFTPALNSPAPDITPATRLSYACELGVRPPVSSITITVPGSTWSDP